jgi:hypothetical protein
MPHMLKFLLFAILFCQMNLVDPVAGQQQSTPTPPRYKIKSISQERIAYDIFGKTGEGSIDASNLNFKGGVTGSEDPLNLFFTVSDDIKLELLAQGKVTLRDSAVATPAELEAQRKATAKRPNPQGSNPTKPSPPGVEPGTGGGNNLGNFWDRFWKIIVGLASLGILAPIAGKLYREIRLKRRIELLFAGDQAAGKTALCERLHNPGASRQYMEKLPPTEAMARHRAAQPFPVGKFEIFSRFFDTPGSKPSLAFKQKKAWFASRLLVYVVAPSENPSQDCKSSEAVAYRCRQLGYMKVFLEVMLLADLAVKPKLLILFINKFDLLSELNPEDSQAKERVKAVAGMFSDHIKLFNLIAKQANLKPNLEFGSALEDWNCDKVRVHIERALNYG